MTKLSGTGIWSTGLRFGDPGEAADAVAEIDDLGYTAVWIPDVGGDVTGAMQRLLAATKHAVVATGVLILWLHEPTEIADAHARLTATFGDRLLVGIGVSHGDLIDSMTEPGKWHHPLAAMHRFLDALDAAPVPLGASNRVLGALGPKMTEIARTRAAGVHPYNITPEHTARARELLGPDALVLPEQAVVLATDATEARRLGRMFFEHYLQRPNYTNNLRRLGFTDDDLAGTGSDRLIDALVAWGDVDAIAARVREHREAGADHVCIQVITESGLARPQWRELAPALIGTHD